MFSVENRLGTSRKSKRDPERTYLDSFEFFRFDDDASTIDAQNTVEKIKTQREANATLLC